MKWLVILAVVALLSLWAVSAIRHALKPKTVITQSRSVTTHVAYTSKTTHYDEGDFSVDVPSTWAPLPRPPHTYQSFSWQSSDRVTDGQIIEIFEDTIPENFAVNRILIVEGEGDHLTVDGTASDNCTNYTLEHTGVSSSATATAKWQGVEFNCDTGNTERDVIGTSSKDGINKVLLQSPSTHATHKFLFTYTDYSMNPDYTVFYNVLNSLKMN